jgi:hypothetical protein
MTRVLLVGLDPETFDFSDPALPPGMTAEKVQAGIAVAVKQFTERGWESDIGMIRPDETAGPAAERQLRVAKYDCVVIGAGVRLPPRHLHCWKSSSTIRKGGAGAAIAFNTARMMRRCRPMGSGWKPGDITAVLSGRRRTDSNRRPKDGVGYAALTGNLR